MVSAIGTAKLARTSRHATELITGKTTSRLSSWRTRKLCLPRSQLRENADIGGSCRDVRLRLPEGSTTQHFNFDQIRGRQCAFRGLLTMPSFPTTVSTTIQ